MWETIKKAIHDCLTENDGASYCPVRILGFGLATPATITYLVGGGISIYNGHFDFNAYATGFTEMMGGFGVLGLGVAAKAFTDNRS